MCVLHNLSYRLDAEVPTRYRQLEYNARNAYTDKASTGCFSNKSDRMMVRARDPAPPPVHLASAPGARVKFIHDDKMNALCPSVVISRQGQCSRNAESPSARASGSV